MIVNEQNFAKRSSARQNLRDQRCDVRLLIESGNDDRDGFGEGGKVCHCASGTFSVQHPTFNHRISINSQSAIRNRKADDGIRTRDLRFTKPLLYQLSYVGVYPGKIGTTKSTISSIISPDCIL